MASAADEIEAQQLLRLPESFPFTISVGVADLRRHEGFNIHRQGLNMDMVALRKARAEAPPKSSKKMKKDKPAKADLFDMQADEPVSKNGSLTPPDFGGARSVPDSVRSCSSTLRGWPQTDKSDRRVEIRPSRLIDSAGAHAAVYRWVNRERAVVSMDAYGRATTDEPRNSGHHVIVDHIPIMLNMIDADGRVVWINHAWERILGWSLEEIQGLDILAEAYPDPAYRQQVLQFIRAGGGWRDFSARRKDGTIIETSWAVVHLSDGTIIGIGKDITERTRAEKAVHASRRLAAHSEARVERERTELARELHDQLGQILTGLKMDVAGLQKQLVAREPLPRALGRTTDMMETIDAIIQMTRRISRGLRPIVLDRLGLLEAIEWQAQDFERHSGIRCRCRWHVESLQIDAAASTQVFRIVQEALTNAMRHAHASRVNIVSAEQRGALRVEVRDNGRGISEIALSDPEALGLVGMRERALLVAGQVTVRRGHRKGTW